MSTTTGITVNVNRLAAIVRQLAATASIVIGALGTANLPTAVRGALVGVGGLVLAVEHFLGGQAASTPTTSTTSVPAVPHPAAAPAPAAPAPAGTWSPAPPAAVPTVGS